MEIKQLNRIFVINRGGEKVTISDPNPSYSLAEVSDILSDQYPEMINAKFDSPRNEGDNLVYEISRNYGTKG